MPKVFLILLFVGCTSSSFSQNSYTKRRTLDVYSYSFDGIDSKVSFPHSDSLNIERTDPFSIETWIKIPVATGTQYLFNKYDVSLSRGIFMYISNGQLWFSMQNGASNKITTLITDSSGYVLLFNSHLPANKWLQIIMTYDGSSDANGLKFYFSGKLYPTFSVYANSLTGTIQNTQPIYLGKQSSTYSTYKQSVTRIFRKVLTQSEITTLYNNGLVNYHPNISRCVLDMQVRNDQFSTNYNVIDSALGNNGTTAGMTSGQKVRVDSMHGISDMAVQTYSGQSLYYNTFGTTGGGLDGSNDTPTHSPFTDRFRTPIVYDHSSNQTYIGYVKRAGIGFGKQSALLKIIHDGKMVSPTGYADYIYSGSTDGHMAPGITITPDNEILMVHETISHTERIYIEKTIGKSPNSLTLLSERNDTCGYPQLTRIGSNIFLWLRYGISTDDIFKSSDNGITWSKTQVVTVSGTPAKWAYSMTVYDSTKLRYMITMRSGNIGFTDNFYIESNDGITFYNASHSFSKNVVTDGVINQSELVANCLASTTPSDSVNLFLKCVVATPSGKIVSITTNGFGYNLTYWNGTNWQTNSLDLPYNADNFFVLYPYSDSHFVFWRIENRNGYNVVVQYETTDFFNTIDAGTVISDPNTNHEQLNGTFNINDARKVVVAANALGETENKLFIYEFTP